MSEIEQHVADLDRTSADAERRWEDRYRRISAEWTLRAATIRDDPARSPDDRHDRDQRAMAADRQAAYWRRAAAKARRRAQLLD